MPEDVQGATGMRSVSDTVDESFILKALAMADPNVLRLCMYHVTRDPELAAMRTVQASVWAGALYTYELAPEHHERVRAMAFEFLKKYGVGFDESSYTDRAAIRETMELFGQGKLNDSSFRLGLEEAGFDDFPRDVVWTNKPSDEVLKQYNVIVIGAGVSGIAAAVHLQRLGLAYSVIERQAQFGGTWSLNDYPNIRVDSTSLIYQYKFEKKYPWTEFFASGGETLKYLQHIAKKYEITDKIRFNTEVIAGAWDEATQKWNLTIRSKDGEAVQVSASFIISASGLFSTPKLPDIRGIEQFEGIVTHTTNWDPNYDVRGKKIAQIGTGATGVQLMPYLAEHAEHLTVFQRTANWILPMEGYRDRIPAEIHWLNQNFPLYWHWFGYAMYFTNSQLEGLQALDIDWQKSGGIVNERNDLLRQNGLNYIQKKLGSRPDLAAKATPNYPPMARRPTVDSGWFDALMRDNVELVTDGIDHAVSNGLVTKDGKVHECDMIVCAAGFATTRYLFPAEYVGRDGATFEALWKHDGPRAYLGMTAPGFPNFFIFFGPSAQARGGSFYSMAEGWSRYALKSMVAVIEGGFKSIECTPEAFAEYNKELDHAAKSLIWEKFGKGFYYLTNEGRSVVNAPWLSPEYHDRLYCPKLSDYKLQ